MVLMDVSVTRIGNIQEIGLQINAALKKNYTDNNPCPMCGGRNVTCIINSIDKTHVSFTESCNDCNWKRETQS